MTLASDALRFADIGASHGYVQEIWNILIAEGPREGASKPHPM